MAKEDDYIEVFFNEYLLFLTTSSIFSQLESVLPNLWFTFIRSMSGGMQYAALNSIQYGGGSI